MENNKTYFRNIHWVFLISLASALVYVFLEPKLFFNGPEADYKFRFFLVSCLHILFFYTSVGIAFSNWKAAGIAAATAIVIVIVDYYSIKEFNATARSIFFILSAVPFFVFIVLHAGRSKKMIPLYFLLFVVTSSTAVRSYAFTGFSLLLGFLRHETGDILGYFISISSSIAAHIFSVICLGELINYTKEKTYTKKTTLLNLGNDYDKLNSVIVFWALKIMLLLLVLGTMGIAYNTANNYFRADFYHVPEGKFYFLITGIIEVLCCTGLTLFLAWYLRKLVLEVFITYDTGSKFTYWLCMLPVIGVFVFLAIYNGDKKRWEGKVAAIEKLAGSSATGVTAIVFVVISLRVLVALAARDGYSFMSTAITAGLFIWLITDRMGYYVNMVLTGIGLVGVFIFIFSSRMADSGGDDLAILFGLLLLNMVQLILILPVYHFGEFEYIPDENPDPETVENLPVLQ